MKFNVRKFHNTDRALMTIYIEAISLSGCVVEKVVDE